MISSIRRHIGLILIAASLAGTRPAAGAESELRDVGQRQKVEQALPDKALAPPKKPRKLLIFDLNVGYGGHASIPTANYALARMGEKAGAFQVVVSRDPKVFEPESLRRFDAVFFNNTVGNLFEDPKLRQSLVEFVYGGGGMMGVHGTTVAFTRWPGAVEDWPEFGLMIGARGASHRDAREPVFIRLDDPGHPLTGAFDPGGFAYRDEFFRVGDPYSRTRVRVLLSIDNQKTDPAAGGPARGQVFRKDGDYALSWVRNYGRGRVFYSTIAHNPDVFWDPMMLKFYLGAAQFVLGDLDAPTVPSARLTPALRAQEKLGWRLGVEAYTFHKFTFFEAIDKTSELGVAYMGGLSFQRVSKEIAKNFTPELSDDELKQIRLKLDAAGVRLPTCYIQEIPGDEAGCRKVFEFARKMGIETIISEPKVSALDTIEKFCDAYDIKVALHNHDRKASPNYWHPDEILKVCKGRSPRIGACADIGYWMRDGIDAVQGIRTLKDRLITIQVHDLDKLTAAGHDVPWGTGAGRTRDVLKEIHSLGMRPTMFGLEYSYDFMNSMPAVAASARFFNEASVELAGRQDPR